MAKVKVSKKDIIKKTKAKKVVRKNNVVKKKKANEKISAKNNKKQKLDNTLREKNIDKATLKRKVVLKQKLGYKTLNKHTLKEYSIMILDWLKKVFKKISFTICSAWNSFLKKVKNKKDNKTIKQKKLKKGADVILREDSVSKPRCTLKSHYVWTYYVVVFVLGLVIGYIPFTKVKPTKVTNIDHRNCKYGDWSKTEVNYCLVNSDGKPYEGEYVKYSLDAKDGLCMKYTRKKVCE